MAHRFMTLGYHKMISRNMILKTTSILGYSTFIIMEFSFNQHSFINTLLSDNSVLYRFYGIKRKIFIIA